MNKTFDLSPSAVAVLEQIAAYNRTSEAAALEAIIQEFSPSTPEERKQQGLDRMKAWSKAEADAGRPLDATAWRKGYNAGWMAFQMRKATSLFARLQHKDEPAADQQ